jgi:hypothetical protein
MEDLGLNLQLNLLSLNDDTRINTQANIIINFFRHVLYNSKLRIILDSKEINHKKNILKEISLKRAHIYCKINKISGQVFGILLEDYIINKFIAVRVSSRNGNGDFSFNNKNYELKCSLGGKTHNKFNYVQIRLNHSCDFILTAYVINSDNIQNNGRLYVFRITYLEMSSLCLNMKYVSYAHGTKNNNSKKNILDLEFAIRLKYKSTNWKYFMKYCIFEN